MILPVDEIGDGLEQATETPPLGMNPTTGSTTWALWSCLLGMPNKAAPRVSDGVSVKSIIAVNEKQFPKVFTIVEGCRTSRTDIHTATEVSLDARSPASSTRPRR